MNELNKKRAFTLVEILVVMSVIAVMSSVSLIALNSAREKARIAQLLQFDANIYRVLGSKLVAAYEFSDASNLAKDNSTNGKNGSLSPAGNAIVPTSVTGVKDLAIDFNFSKNVSVSGFRSLNYPDGLTISAFIYPRKMAFNDVVTVPSAVADDYTYWIYTERGPFIYTLANNSQSIRIKGFQNDCAAPASNYIYFAIPVNDRLSLNKWNHVVISYKNSTAKYWVNSKLVGQSNIAGGIDSCDAATTFRFGGAGNAAGYRANGIMDEVRIYAQGLD